VARRPSRTRTFRGRGAMAAVLLPPATECCAREGRGRASVTIPRPDGRPTWFVYVSAASRIGSRTNPSHGSPRRRIGEGKARDWLCLDRVDGHRDQRTPTRDASAPPPQTRLAPVPGSAPERGVPARRQKPHGNIARGVRSCKCPYFFGLRFSRVGRVWTNNLQCRRYLPPSSTACGDVHFKLST
jgi:hypothetical protein